jgi:hypothetical protein
MVINDTKIRVSRSLPWENILNPIVTKILETSFRDPPMPESKLDLLDLGLNELELSSGFLMGVQDHALPDSVLIKPTDSPFASKATGFRHNQFRRRQGVVFACFIRSC